MSLIHHTSDIMQKQRSVRFSRASLWQLQRQYFEEAHINAWREGDVPHYVTSNPHMAETYAALLLAFFRDRARQRVSGEPIYIVELGTGSGRFSYHLLKSLRKRCEAAAFKVPNFVYVMTDFVEETLRFWESHPRLQPFFEQGILDLALFDAEKDSAIRLRKAGKILKAGTLSQPLVAIGNYFFDSIPQELFYMDKGNMQNVNVTLSHEDGYEPESAAEALENLEIEYSYKPADSQPFDDALQNQLLDSYRIQLQDSHLLFPHMGLQCISRLQALSRQGLMLLTADKGHHRLQEWQQRPAPYIARHGSFSLSANYHALKRHCKLWGGKALFPKHYENHISVGCLLYTEAHEAYKETQLAYDTAVNDFGPDDYFSIKKHIEMQIPELSVRDMCAYTRLSGYDARLFSQFIPRFYELTEDFSEQERYAFLQLTARVWDGFYPLGEDKNLALELGTLLMGLDFYGEALSFFQLSEQIYGESPETLCLKAFCYAGLEDSEAARSLLETCLYRFPEHEGIPELLRLLEIGE